MQYLRHKTLRKNLKELADDVYFIPTSMHLEDAFHKINNLHQNVMFTMEDVIEN